MYVCIVYIYIYIYIKCGCFRLTCGPKCMFGLGYFFWGGGMYKGYVSTMFCRCIFLDDKDVAGVCIACIGGQTFVLT